MDERFSLVMQAPSNALKQINAGRLRGKSDINPQWKIEAMTEVYGLCGEGWYHECTKEDIIKLDDNQVMVFMEVHVYIKNKDGEWSKPIVGFGGDFIVKKENNGMHFNDEAKKMCYTDALGNALKNLGVANDIYRGMWDGSKYTRTEDSALAQEQEPFKTENGTLMILARNGNYYPATRLSNDQLNSLLNNNKYSPIFGQIRQLLANRTE